MTIPPNQREAADIATLVELVLMDPDPRTDDHAESELAAARAVAGYVKRAKIGQTQPPKQTREVLP